MKDFNKVAIVNLFDDYACDDYAVALYDDEAKLICDSWLVVVNGWGNENAADFYHHYQHYHYSA